MTYFNCHPEVRHVGPTILMCGFPFKPTEAISSFPCCIWCQIHSNFDVCYYTYSLTELPECQVPLAMRPLLIDQILEMAMHSSYDSEAAQVPMGVLINVTQSPKAHRFIIREGVVKKMLQVCELKQTIIGEQQLSQSQQGGEDPVAITVLKYVITISSSLFLYHIISSPQATPFTHCLCTHTHTHTHTHIHTCTHSNSTQISYQHCAGSDCTWFTSSAV